MNASNIAGLQQVASKSASAMRMIESAVMAKTTTVVPSGAALDGTMTAKEDLAIRIDGEFKGKLDIEAGGAIHIGPGAVVECDKMVADFIYVEGRVKGSLHARKGLELSAGARINGKICYEGDMDMHPGARVRGEIDGPADSDDKP